MNMNNLHFGEGNLRSVQNDKYCYLTWSLPSKKTCPYATELCKKKCFAKKNETFKTVLRSREQNFEKSKEENFEKDVIELIDKYLNKKKCKDKLLIVRIHTSGDFYSKEYLDKWISITNNYKGNENIQFQSYTKSVVYLKDIDLDNVNIHFVYSKWDDTKKEDILLAQELNIPIFYATNKENVDMAKFNGIYICPKTSDGTCKECYKKNHKLILVNYH